MKKLLAMLLSFVLLLTALCVGSLSLSVSACEGDESYEEFDEEFDDENLEEEDTIYREGDYRYTVVNKEAIIIDYDGAGDDVIIPSTINGYPVTSIGESAFGNCDSLISVTIPDSVTKIDAFIFESCDNLTTATIGNGVTTVGWGVFENCKNLTTVYIGSGATYIGTDTEGAFEGCRNLKNVIVSEDNVAYATIDGVLLNKEKTVLEMYPCGRKGDYVIPEGVKTIRAFAFARNNNLTSVIIPDSVTIIGGHAFSGCTALTTVTVGKSVTTIWKSAFYGCTGLKSVVIPNSVTVIEEGAFGYCENLADVYYTGTEGQAKAIDVEINYDFDPDEEWDPDRQNFFLRDAKWHYNCNFATITTQPKSVSVKVNQKATVSVKASGDGLTYTWYACDVKNPNKYYPSSSMTTNTYSVTLTPERVGRKVYCLVTDKYGNSVKSNTVTLNVAKTPVSELKVSLSKTSYTYNGKVQKPSVTVKDSKGNVLKKGTDYTVSYPDGCLNVDTYKVTIKMKGNYTGTTTRNYKIKPIDVSKCKITLSATAYTYNGQVKNPTVTVRNHNGTKLNTTHYTVTYASGRKNVGTYKVTIKMKRNYTGTKVLTFKINPVKTTVKSLTAGKKSLKVAVTKKTTQVSGYQIQYSTSKSFKPYKTKTLSGYKKTSTTLTGLSAKKTYYVRVRTYKVVNGRRVYSAWSTIKYKKTK